MPKDGGGSTSRRRRRRRGERGNLSGKSELERFLLADAHI